MTKLTSHELRTIRAILKGDAAQYKESYSNNMLRMADKIQKMLSEEVA